MVQVGVPHPLFVHGLMHQGTLKLRLKQMVGNHLPEEGPLLLPGHRRQNIKIGANNLTLLLSCI